MTFRSPEMNLSCSYPDRQLLLSFPLYSLLQCFSVCCPIHFFSLTWLLCPVLFPTSCVNAAVCSSWAETQDAVVASQGGRQRNQHIPCPVFLCLVLCIFATQLSVYPKTVPCSSHSCLSVCTQKVMGLSAYLENSSCYRVPYQIACKCIRFVVQKMNEFILIHVNYIFSQ